MVVCDEAQYAKNPTTQRTCAVKALKSKHRSALTGTPVENGLIEFWCIMDFVQPGLLGSWADFRKEFERPIVEGNESERDAKINTLLSKIKGCYLRRMKDQVLDLPGKTAQILETKLSDFQFQIYQTIVREAKVGGRGAKLAAISKLLMLCAHPSTARGFPIVIEKEDVNCPKLKKTIEILDEIRRHGEKAIVFTDYKVVQRVLQDAIRTTLGIWPDIINGEITKNRQSIIDIFSEKEGFNVIILGHQVAGVGLNITSANHVIHYTRPWNPAKENQATDRAYRIGQNKPVSVYYPIVKDERFKTVEDRLDELIKSKEKLARDVLRPTKDMQVKIEDLIDCIDEEI
jgi:SNF2 family DNA or RNA helicase